MTIFRGAVAMLMLLLAGCSMPLEPDLATLYAPVAAQPKRHPLIVIPGIMGSRLHDADSNREMWPGSFLTFVAGRNFSDFALPIPGSEAIAAAPRHPTLTAGGIFHEIAGQDFYGQIIRTLTTAGGYTCVPLAEVTAASNCVLFSWDWRKGMVAAAAELDGLVRRMGRLRNDPELKVDIVAHSAGGLLARYFVRYGGADVLDEEDPVISFSGGKMVRQAILIGTPNYGSISALQQAITGINIGLSSIKPETIATMPVMFQLLPHPDRTWMIDITGKRIDLNLYDVATWRENEWSIWDPKVRERVRKNFTDEAAAEAYLDVFEEHFERQLARAANFHRALSRRVETSPNQYIVFGSGCVETPARCLLENVDGTIHVRLRPSEITHPIAGIPYKSMMIEPGDGSVTKASLLARDSLDPDATRGDFPIAWSIFICEQHQHLTGNATFRDNLLNLLLYGVPQTQSGSRAAD